MTEARVAWDEAGSRLSSLGLKLKMHFEQAYSEDDKDGVKNALQRMADAVEDAFTAMSSVAKDPAVKADVIDMGRTFADAMSATLGEVSDDLRKTFTCSRLRSLIESVPAKLGSTAEPKVAALVEAGGQPPAEKKAVAGSDYFADVAKYVASVDEAAVNGIVKHCGIALRRRDSSFVAMSDKSERETVRESFLKKKLALTAPDAELDAAVKAIGETMKGDNDKPRVTVYYLLAEKYGKLDLFH